MNGFGDCWHAVTTSTTSTGLGLAIARQIAESHDGRMLLADAPGPGSTFVIWLPERAIAGAPERGTEPPAWSTHAMA